MARKNGTVGKDKMVGTIDSDVLNAGNGADELYGEGGNDLLIGGNGPDKIYGGLGIDTASYATSILGVTANLVTGLASGGEGDGDRLFEIENLTGSAFADHFTGDASDNAFDGGNGNDTLLGGDGDDRLTGGLGADVINGGTGVDTADYRYSALGVTVNLATGVGSAGDAAGDSLAAIENVSGSNSDDILTGDAAANRLVGRQGSDQLFGGDGDDVLVGGGGYDHHDGGNGVDTVDYSDSWGTVVVNLATGKGTGAEAAKDTYVSVENVLGSAYDDQLSGNASANRLNGGAGNDILSGGGDNDVLVGGAGADVLNGGTGLRDAADYQNAAASVTLSLATGGTGGDAAGDSFTGIEFVYGSSFSDTITGDDAINRLVGNNGNDILDGGLGNDYLVGGAGNDTMTGGLDADVFVFDGAFGNDTITDFAAGAGRTDRIWLTGGSLTDFASVLSHAAETAGGVVISDGGNGSITLTGVSLASLHADDFLFG